jgi:hypothetical protein
MPSIGPKALSLVGTIFQCPSVVAGIVGAPTSSPKELELADDMILDDVEFAALMEALEKKHCCLEHLKIHSGGRTPQSEQMVLSLCQHFPKFRSLTKFEIDIEGHEWHTEFKNHLTQAFGQNLLVKEILQERGREPRKQG